MIIIKNNIIHGDCLEELKSLEENSVDLVLTDPPYNQTRNEWDVSFSLDKWFEEVWRVLKEDGLIVMTAQDPFGAKVVINQGDYFKYDLVWNKVQPSGYLNANKMPLRQHERILVFGKKKGTFNPIKKGNQIRVKTPGPVDDTTNYGDHKQLDSKEYVGRHPTTILEYSNADQTKSYHPTEKPIELFRYLIKLYSNEGDIILDPFAGSGTAAVAAKQANRDSIVIEKEADYIETIRNRVNSQPENLKQFQKQKSL